MPITQFALQLWRFTKADAAHVLNVPESTLVLVEKDGDYLWTYPWTGEVLEADLVEVREMKLAYNIAEALKSAGLLE